MKKSVVIPQMKKTKRARYCLFDEREIIDACLLVIDGSIRVCCNDFVTHTHTYTHTHTHIYGEPPFWSSSTGPGQVTWKQGVRGRINILKVLKATGPGQVTWKQGVRDWINILKSYWPGAGRLSKGSVRGWINILKSYWTGAGVFPERGASTTGQTIFYFIRF